MNKKLFSYKNVQLFLIDYGSFSMRLQHQFFLKKDDLDLLNSHFLKLYVYIKISSTFYKPL